jgi:hypothetical protein
MIGSHPAFASPWAVGRLYLEGANVHVEVDDPGEARAALVPLGNGPSGLDAIDGRAAGQEGVRERWAAVVLERAKPRVDRRPGSADQVGRVEAAAAGADADQVVAQTPDRPGYVGRGRWSCLVPGDDVFRRSVAPKPKILMPPPPLAPTAPPTILAVIVELVTVSVPAPLLKMPPP